jgi:cytochrome c oxidase accessory protein FixG
MATPARKTIPIAVADDGLVPLYAAQQKIYPRSVQGLFARWRWAMVALTQLFFYGMPWLQWGQRQAMLFDLEARRFYIFNLVLYPQDFIYLTGLLVVSALSLFLFTAVAGRLWCGFACPQTVYSEIFLWVERHVEGDRAARMRLDSGGWTAAKLLKKATKHAVWIALALFTGFSFVAYFTPARELLQDLLHNSISAWNLFWVLFYGLATYGNAGFLREQVCKYMCPYARFQSAMFDKDTLIVSYDTQRGDPRGARSRKADPVALGLGSCVDCTLCVQVCPTGIDIRQGLQYECINCAACVDVCDGVMDKMGYARGLIRFATQNAMARHWSPAQMLRRVFRPRVLVYTVVLWSLVIGLLVSLSLRTPLKVDVVRDRAALSRIVAGGQLENIYRLQLMNATESPQRYRISAHGLDGLVLASDEWVAVDAVQSRWVVVRLHLPYGSAPPGPHAMAFDIQSADGLGRVSEKSTFIVPR